MNEFDRKISVVIEYLYDLGDADLPAFRGRVFDTLTFEHWAVEEMITDIKAHPNEDPVKTISMFKQKMLDYSKLNDKTSNIFEIARCTAEDLLDIFSAMTI